MKRMSKILVIEDESAVRENLIELLSEEGYKTIGAQDGEEGLQRVWEELPDLIICDITMPKLDGYGVLARINQDLHLANIPFLFITARVAREDLRMGMGMGADDYITKPFLRSEVLQAITTRLGRVRRLEALTEKKLADLDSRVTTDLPHELMAPLSITIGYSEVLAEQVDQLESKEIRRLARDIHHSAQRLMHLVENSLLYAELRAQYSNPEHNEAPRTLHPGEGARPAPLLEIMENTAQLAGRAGDLVAHLQPVRLLINEQYLEKILDEVLDNAFKFSKAGSQVRVEGALLPGNPALYRLEISDHGRGMTAEQIRRIDGAISFDRHVYERQGLGLGLVLVKLICHLPLRAPEAGLVHGSLRIQSIPGEATRVEVLLPVQP